MEPDGLDGEVITGASSLPDPPDYHQPHPNHDDDDDDDNQSGSTSAGGEEEDIDDEEEEENQDQVQVNHVNQMDQRSAQPQFQQQQQHPQQQQHHHQQEPEVVSDEEEEVEEEEDHHGDDDEDEDEEDGSAVFPPPVIAEISEDSQEYYMKPPEKMDDGPKPFRCDLCDKRFQEKSSVYRHIKEVHHKIIVLMGEDGRVAKVKSSPVHSCCGTTFTTRRALLRHQKSAACCASGPLLHPHEQDSSNKRKRVNGVSSSGISNKRNGNGQRTGVTAAAVTSSEDDHFDEEDEESLDEDPDHSSHLSNAPPAASSLSGMPYRCPYGVCPLYFNTKNLMMTHLKAAHHMRMDLVSVSAPSFSHSNSSNLIPVRPSLATTSSPGLTSQTISVTDKKFPCNVFGCQAAFTRKDRLNLHIRTKHSSDGGSGSSHSSSNNNVNTSNSSGSSGFIPGLKVKLPPIHNDYRMIMSTGKGSSSSSSSISRHQPHATSAANIVARPAKETIHPKKHACDYPGCEKSYTKNSHVKRHKLSAHPDLFSQSNGAAAGIGSSPAVAAASRHHATVSGSLQDGEEEEDDDDEEDENAAASDDDNFEYFDDQDVVEPVVSSRSRGKSNLMPRMAPTLKPSFLSLTSKSNGSRKKK